jgi:hypothetical protein
MSSEFLDLFDRIEMGEPKGLAKKSKRSKKSYSIDQIRNRALAMGFSVEVEGTRIFLTPPDTAEYQAVDQAQAWLLLDKLESEMTTPQSN